MRPEHLMPELERDPHERGLQQEHEEEFERGKAEPYDEQIADRDLDKRGQHDQILTAVRAIFDKRQVDLDRLDLGAQERAALEALRSAMTGKDARYESFVFAEQRQVLLEQALAALQPILALDVSVVPELHEAYEHIVEQVAQLRERLTNLEDSQDEELLIRHALERAEEEGAEDEDEDEDGDGSEEAAADVDQGDDASAKEAEERERAPRRSSLTDEADDLDAPDPARSPERTSAKPKSGVLSRLGRALGLGGKADDEKG
jgi:hypothetical protein